MFLLSPVARQKGQPQENPQSIQLCGFMRAKYSFLLHFNCDTDDTRIARDRATLERQRDRKKKMGRGPGTA
jgi:hypothetical protein